MRKIARKKFPNPNRKTDLSLSKNFQVFPVNSRGHKEVVFSNKSHHYIKCLQSTSDSEEARFFPMHKLEINGQNTYYCRRGLRALVLYTEMNQAAISNDVNKAEYFMRKVLEKYPDIMNTGLQTATITLYLDLLNNTKKSEKSLMEWAEVLLFSKTSVLKQKCLPNQAILSMLLHRFLKRPKSVKIEGVDLHEVLEKFSDVTLRGTTFIPSMIESFRQQEGGHFFSPQLLEPFYRSWLKHHLISLYCKGVQNTIPSYVIDQINEQIDAINYMLNGSVRPLEEGGSDEQLTPINPKLRSLLHRLLDLKLTIILRKNEGISRSDLAQLLLMKNFIPVTYLRDSNSRSMDDGMALKICQSCNNRIENTILNVQDVCKFEDAIDAFLSNSEKIFKHLKSASLQQLSHIKHMANKNYDYIIDFNNYLGTKYYNKKSQGNGASLNDILSEVSESFENTPVFINKRILLVCQLSNNYDSHSRGSLGKSHQLTYQEVLKKFNNSQLVSTINVYSIMDDFAVLYCAFKQLERIVKSKDDYIPLPKIVTNDIYREFTALCDIPLHSKMETLLDSITFPVEGTVRGHIGTIKNSNNSQKMIGRLYKVSLTNDAAVWHIHYKNALYCVQLDLSNKVDH